MKRDIQIVFWFIKYIKFHCHNNYSHYLRAVPPNPAAVDLRGATRLV